jgi:hypothetical protein
MINEKRLEEALKFLADTDEEDAKLGAGLEYLKDKQKRDKAIHIVSNSNDKSFSIKEQAYYASDVYGEYILQKQALAEKVGITQNKRAKECLVIDVWRTLEASRRKNNL